MNSLIVVSFNDMFQADQVLISLVKLQQEELIDLEDAVVVVKDKNGRTRVRQTMEVSTEEGAISGSWWGLVIGLILGGPIVGLVSGAAFGALAARLNDIGIDNKFIKEASNELTPNSSAIFILAKAGNQEKVLEEFRRFDGKILKTNLSQEVEAEIKAALSKEQGDGQA